MKPRSFFFRTLFLGASLFVLALAAPGLVYGEEGRVLSEGTWVDKGYDVAGGWKIVEEKGGRFLLFDEKFKTRKGPDLKIFFSPQPLSKVTGRTATRGSVKLTNLEVYRGAQRFEIPADLDLDRFASLLIHCEKFSKLWGGGALR